MKGKIFGLSAALAAVLLASCAGKSEKSKSKIQVPRTASSAKDNVADFTPSPAPPEYAPYSIKLVNRTLSMYERTETGEFLVKSILIDPEYYPSEDISQLEDGISAYTKESGFEILENFAN